MSELKIGASICVTPMFANQEEGHTSPMHKEKHWGTIVYIHPSQRFAVVEFTFRSGIIRESFKLETLLQ